MKQIVRVNASALKECSCGRRFLLQVYEGYTSKHLSTDIVYGSSYHKGVEVYELTQGDEKESLKLAMEYWNTVSPGCVVKSNKSHLNETHLYLALSKYFKEAKSNEIFTSCRTLKLGNDILVEKKFSIKIYEDDDFIVLLQGTIDRLVQMLNSGAIAIADWKTTSAHKVDDYFSGYKLSPQLRVYVWAVRKLAQMYPDREYAKLINTRPAVIAFIYGAFLKSPTGVEFHRSPLYKFTKEDLLVFEDMMMMAVYKLVDDIRRLQATGKYPSPNGILNGSCIAPFGGLCKYFDACSSMVGLNEGTDGTRLFKGILESKLTKKPYTPLNFGGEGKI